MHRGLAIDKREGMEKKVKLQKKLIKERSREERESLYLVSIVLQTLGSSLSSCKAA